MSNATSDLASVPATPSQITTSEGPVTTEAPITSTAVVVTTSSEPITSTTPSQITTSPTTSIATSTIATSTSIPPTTSSSSSIVTTSPTSSIITSTTSVETSSKPEATTITVTPSSTDDITSVTVITSTISNKPAPSPTSTTTSSTAVPTPIDPSGNNGGGLGQKSKVAIGVVVPIAAIALLAVLALFWWKKRRARQESKEERRKEVEDYSYNPNADPTIPAVGMSSSENAYEMREDGSGGYRGWGTTTVAGSAGRKASTTMSGGVTDVTSPTRGYNETKAAEPLMDSPYSPEGEILGAMGPSAANNRGDVHRGPSNASSSYSAAGRSDGSDSGLYGNGGTYYDGYAQNPYSDGTRTQELPGQPIIRDNPARRNTRIENPSHYPQQSAGISQNF